MIQPEKVSKVIDFLTKHRGIPEGMTWYEVGSMFGVEPYDKERAAIDERYRRESIRKRTKQIWERHLDRANKKYKLTAYTIGKDGDIVSEKYKEDYKSLGIDIEDFSIEKVSKSNLGIEWVTYRNTPNSDKLIEQFKKAVTNVQPFYITHSKKISRKMLLVYTSDKHYGAHVDEEVSIYKQKDRNKPIMNMVYEAIIEVSKEYGGWFDKVYIFDLGDALDGFNGKTVRGLGKQGSHTLPQNLDNVGQFERYLSEHVSFFESVYKSGISDKYYFIGMGNSNHGGDFDYMAFRALEIYLNARMPEISTYITRKFVDHITIGNYSIVFTHGSDKENTKKPNPLIPNKDTINFYTDYIINNNLTDKRVTVVGGDLHQSSVIIGQRFRYRKVLSQFGESMWMQNNFGHTKPGISFDIIHSDEGVISSYDKIFEYPVSNTGIILE